MNFGYDIFPIDDNRRLSRRAQRYVQNRPLFGDVDLIPTKHGLDSLLKAAFFSQLKKKLQCFVGDAIFRVIEVNPSRFCRHTLAALGIICEKLTEMKFADLLIVSF